MDVSRTQIYDIRNGKIPVTFKMLEKLEAAERRAGIQIRTEGHPLLHDVAVQEQPSDDYLQAAQRESDKAHPEAATSRDQLRKASELVEEIFPDDEEKQSFLFDLIRGTVETFKRHNPAGSKIRRKLAPLEQRKLRRAPGTDPSGDHRQTAG